MSQIQPQFRENGEKLASDFEFQSWRGKDPLADIQKIEAPKKPGVLEESVTLIWTWISELELHAHRLRKLRRKADFAAKVAPPEKK